MVHSHQKIDSLWSLIMLNAINKILLFSLVLLVLETSNAKVKSSKPYRAKSKIACEMSRWPYSRDMNKQDFHKFANRIDRKILTHYLLYEVSTGKSKNLALMLSHYLYATEQNKNLKGFFGVVSEASDLKTDKIRKLNSKEVCEVYLTALNMK